jgi:restriction endonuclease S subunit
MPDDDTVDELLQCTADEVDPYPEMSEKRFDIPLHWTWVPLASIARHQLGKMLNTGKMKGERVKYLRSVNVRQDGRIDLSDVKEMLIPIDELEKYSVKLDDVFVNEGGDVGRNAIWLIESEERFAFQNQLHRLRPICGVSSRYLQLVFRDAKSRGVIAELSSGVTIQHFSASSIRKLAIPLPPLAEQKRIVAKVDELMALCDQLEQKQKQRDNLRIATRKSVIDAISTATAPEELATAWKRINNNWEVIADSLASVDHLKKLILANGASGTFLLKGPRTNFAGLRKTLGELCEIYQPKTISTRELIENGMHLVYGANGVIGRYDKFNHEFEEVLVTCRGATCGTVNVSVPKSWINGNAMVVQPKSNGLSKDYLAMILRGIDYASVITGTAQPQITRQPLSKISIFVPSVAEQKQIVAKVDELMALCDQLEVELNVRNQVAEKFARSVVNAA